MTWHISSDDSNGGHQEAAERDADHTCIRIQDTPGYHTVVQGDGKWPNWHFPKSFGLIITTQHKEKSNMKIWKIVAKITWD